MTKSELRKIKLLEMLQVSKRLDVKSVASTFEISEATTRRLFAQLEGEGQVLRTHGGVQIAPQLGYDYSFRAAAAHRNKEKSAIGKVTAELVVSHERIFLDSGTTVLKFAEALAVKIQTGVLDNLVVVTNSLTHIDTLARWCKVILIGGEIRVERKDVCGTIGEKTLMLFHFDKAFLGADAISLNGGFMTTDERTSKINEIVIERTDKAYVLADSEKFRKSSFIQYATLTDVEAIYTDNGIREETLYAFRNAGAQIKIV
jgi:DeoR family transcriptional regulator, fructose operon transcriptional repressor